MKIHLNTDSRVKGSEALARTVETTTKRRPPMYSPRRLGAAFAVTALILGGTLTPSPAGAQSTPELPLEVGDAGDTVESLQTLLNDFLALGSPNVPLIAEDGVFGTNTKSAVELFETQRTLVVDGVVTRADLDELNRLVQDLEASTAASTVSEGDTGNSVLTWQMALNDHYRLSNAKTTLLIEDGIFGATTTSATRNFEKSSGLQVDGIVEPEDRAAMRDTLDDLRGSGDLPPLVVGDRGQVVDNTQDLLNDYLALSASTTPLIKEDGIFGPNTAAAATEFETAAGLTVDAVLTRAELVTLRRSVENLEANSAESLVQEGSSGQLVEVWQIALDNWIFYTDSSLPRLTADGNFNAATATATRAFEAYAGLQVDGLVEPVDRSTMRATLEDLRNQPPVPETMAAAATMGQLVTASDYNPAEYGQILRLYPAFFDREPDVNGSQYWVIDVYQREQRGLDQIVQYFASPDQTEFAKFYNDIPAADNEAYLTRVYENMFDRVPDPPGFAYWLDLMNKGELDRGGIVFYVSQNPEFVKLHPFGTMS